MSVSPTHAFLTSPMRASGEDLDLKVSYPIFDRLSVEIHIWQVIRNETGKIKTWALVYANPPALRSWHFDSLSEIKGKTTDEIFGDGATEHYLPVVKKIFEEKKAHSFRDYFPNLDKHFRFTCIPFDRYFITTGDDVTEFFQPQRQDGAPGEARSGVQQRAAKLTDLDASIHIHNRIEREKEKIYFATVDGAQEIINSLLNQLLLVELAIERAVDLDKDSAMAFKSMYERANVLMKKLSSVERIDEKTIRESIKP